MPVTLERLRTMGQALVESESLASSCQIVLESLQVMIPDVQSVIILLKADRRHPGGPEGLPRVVSALLVEGEHLQVEAAASPYADFVRTLPISLDEGLLGKALQLRSTLLVKDTNVYDLQSLIAYERSVIVAPLVAPQEVMGCIYLGCTHENRFQDEQRDLVEMVANQASLAFQLVSLQSRLGVCDGLTGLPGHRAFHERLVEAVEGSRLAGKPVSLVLLDLDHFRSFNETLGHAAGDALLREVASLLRDNVLPSDAVFRLGSDEFAVISQDSLKAQAVLDCERLRESVALRFAASAVPVTASIGLACFPDDATRPRPLLKAADDALYVSKRTGRNQVSLAPSPRPEQEGEGGAGILAVLPVVPKGPRAGAEARELPHEPEVR